MGVSRISMLARIVPLIVVASTVSATARPADASSVPGPAITRASLPAGAATSSQHASIDGVACGATNSCVAVGSYVARGVNQALVEIETRGHWQPGTAPGLPSGAISSPASANGPITQLDAVSCSHVGDCVAVGTFKSAAGFVPWRISEVAGLWQSPRAVVLPTNAAKDFQSAALFAVSCSSATSCTAVGTYTDSSNDQLPLSVSEINGAWQPSVAPALPSSAIGLDQSAQLSGIACASPGDCVAVGGFVDATGYEAMALTESDNAWHPASGAVVIAPPSGHAALSSAEFNGLNALSCPTATQCVAVGQFAVSTGYSPVVATMSGSTWSDASVVAVPSAPTLTGPGAATLASVSCSTTAQCTAVGTYGNTTTHLAFSAALTSGSWTATEGSAPLADATKSPMGDYRAVQCFAAGECLVGGDYGATSGTQGLLSTPATAADAPVHISVTRGNQSLRVSWSAPAYDGTTPITSYLATASPSGSTCSSVATSCTISGLHNGQAYTVSVVALNAVGASSPSAPSHPVAPATIPSAPRIVSVSALVGGLRLTLLGPVDNGGSSVTTYDYSTNGGTTWHPRSSGTTSLTLIITGLVRAHTYHVTVRGVNGAGTGAASSIVVARTK